MPFPGWTYKQKARAPFFTRKLTHKAYWIQLKRLRRSAEKTKGTLSTVTSDRALPTPK
jgi:hypothetical protein